MVYQQTNTKICLTEEELQHLAGVKWANTKFFFKCIKIIKFVPHIVTEITSTAVENASKVLETERLI